MDFTATLPTFVVVFMVALVVSMVLIPAMIRLAPHIGMIDKPDPRKVHLQPIPRAGGIGIVLGALLPMLIWLPVTDVMVSYYIGALILLVFGTWDDIAELGHYVKFIGQFAAAIVVVYAGGVVVETFPFMGMEPLSPEIGKPFTVIALVGMVNAINHSDGLDGLAGGESLISLGGILFLASQASGLETMIMVVAVMGGVFGFLRFNSHPARVFMGDGGSQFLGFSLGVLAVLLTQRDNPALSPMLPLLLLGLPIADILVVFWKRAHAGGNWFKATKNHVHHRLLELGFHHYESVSVIYTVQAALVFAAAVLPYAADALLLMVYMVVVVALFLLLRRAEATGWKVHKSGDSGALARFLLRCGEDPVAERIPNQLVAISVSAFMLAGAIGVPEVPLDLGGIAGLLTIALLIRLVMGYRVWFLMLRLLMFVSIALLVFLFSRYTPEGVLGMQLVSYIYFGVLALMLVVAVRMARPEQFRVTPLDYLVVLIVLALAFLPAETLEGSGVVEMALHAILLFYGAELAMWQMRSRWNFFTVSMLLALGITAVRGVL